MAKEKHESSSAFDVQKPIEKPKYHDPDKPQKLKPRHVENEPGRNDLCPCGSGKKYKKCCGKVANN